MIRFAEVAVRETAPIESAHVARLIVVVTDGSRSSVNGLNTQWEQDLRKNLKGQSKYRAEDALVGD